MGRVIPSLGELRSGAAVSLLSEELASVGWRFAGIFVLAISVDVNALGKPGVEAFFPGRELLRSVVFEAQAGVSEAGGEHVGRRLLFGFGKAERCLVLAQYGVRFLGVPGRMTYLKGESEGGRAKSKKAFQQGTIELERGRQLDEDRAKVVAIVQHAGHFQEALQSALAGPEPLNVSDFNCRELLGVEAEHFAIGKFLGIKTPLPLFIGVSRSPNKKTARARNNAPPCPGI